MIRIEIVLKTDDKTKTPLIMNAVAYKINDGLIGGNYEDFYFRTSEINNILDIFNFKELTEDKKQQLLKLYKADPYEGTDLYIQHGIEETLDILGYKVKGINDN